MAIASPFTTRPEDVATLLLGITRIEVPSRPLQMAFFKALGISGSSGKHLLNILKILKFADESGLPTEAWKEYTNSENRGTILAEALANAYPALFQDIFCPYLAEDETLLEYFKQHTQASPKDLELMLQTFRALCEPADFQDMLLPDEAMKMSAQLAASSRGENVPAVKVEPNLQFTIQIHIDPATPDEKIEVIFKYMRKYLLGKDT